MQPLRNKAELARKVSGVRLKAVTRVEALDEQAQWEQHYQKHFRAVLNYIRRLIGSDLRANAEDLTQEAFAIAFANRRHFQRRSSLNTWICGIALNLVRQHVAREALASRMARIFPKSAFTPQSSVSDDPLLLQVQRERAIEILSVVDALPEKLLQPFVACCIFGVSQEEAAAQFGISEGNLRVRIARARALIRRRIAQPGHVT